MPVARVGKDGAEFGHLQRGVVAVELGDGHIEIEGDSTQVFVVANGLVALVGLLSLEEMQGRLRLSVSELCGFEDGRLLFEPFLQGLCELRGRFLSEKSS